MKTLLSVCYLLLASAVFGQGTIKFNNRTGSVDVPVAWPDGSGAGAGVTAQLFLLSGTQRIATPLFPTATFLTGAENAFYVSEPATPVIVPNVSGASLATIVMRAYDGSTFETSTHTWESNPFLVRLGGEDPRLPPLPGNSPLPPALLTGLSGFTFVPEPTVSMIVLLGAAGLLTLRVSSKRV